MSSKGKFYMTTAIAYTSGKPHIGNTYEIVLADAIARFRRQEGYDVYFQTGTDEHGQKIQEKAEKAGITPKEYVEQQLKAGKDVLLEIEMQGGMLVKKQFPDAMLVFVTPPSAEILKDRLTGRGTESAEEIERRLHRASEEADFMKQYDYILVNDSLEAAVEDLHHLIQSGHHKTAYCAELIKSMTQQLNTLVGK